MSTDNSYEQILAEERQQRDRLPAVKALLCEALRARGIATVSVEYDGEGDSGQISDIIAYDSNQQPVSLDEPVTLALHKPEEPTSYGTLFEALDDFAWTVLGVYHGGGFEINDGGYGTIAIDANKAKVTINHNDRVTVVDSTVTEV